MSITYDPEKWTNPLRATEAEQTQRKSASPVIVSLRELRYFKVQQDMRGDGIDFYFTGERKTDIKVKKMESA